MTVGPPAASSAWLAHAERRSGPALPPIDALQRRRRVAEDLGEADVLVAVGAANARYLAGVAASNLTVVVTEGEDVVLTDERYRAPVEAAVIGAEVVIGRDALAEVARRFPGRRIGVDARHLDWSSARRFAHLVEGTGGSLVPLDATLERARAVKDPAEVARLRRACRVTVDALAGLVAEGALRPGVSERAFARALDARFVEEGADGAGFATIVASGPHSAVPHHAPTDRAFAEGDLVTVDAGAFVDGYHADMTRTFAIGRPDPVLAGIHALVETAAAAGRAAVRADVSASQVDDAARGVIERAGHGARFVHPTGHGVGLDIHEAPAVAKGGTATLRPAMVLTVEPGVYLPGLGGVRIEDCLLVTAEAPEVLTEHPRGLEHD